MSCKNNTPNVNKTFIIKPSTLTGSTTPVLSACTSMYTNLVQSCSGDTTITLGTGLVTFNSNINVQSITATTIEATTYFSGGTNIIDIINTKVENGLNVGGGNEIFSGKSGTTLIFRTISGGSNTTITQVGNVQKIDVTIPPGSTNTFVTGGTYNSNTDVILLDRNDATTVDITGITDTFTTGGTYNNVSKLITLDRNDGNNYTINLSTISGITSDVFTTGGTYDNGTKLITLDRNDGNNYTINLNAISGATTNTFATGFTYNDTNTFTISRNNGEPDLSATINSVTGFTVNGDLVVTGDTNVQGLTGTSALLSANTDTILTLVGSGSTNPIFKIEGSSGELFTVTDSLLGSLFAVNNISGLPVFEVFSDDRILMGSYLVPSLNTTVRTIATSGTTNIYSIPTSAYTGAFFDYTLVGNGGARSGNIMSIWSGATAEFNEVTTNDIGSSVTGVTFNVSVSGNSAILAVSAVTGTYTIKTIVRSI